MSLIYGLCLPRKIYLVSDSRVTSLHDDGAVSFKDDFGKWLDINPRLAVVVANSAHQASWMLQKLFPMPRTERMIWDFTDLENHLRKNLKDVGDAYYSVTGEISNSACFIFGGFEKNAKLVIESRRIGDVMSAPFVQHGDGHQQTQSVDMEIMNALLTNIQEAAKRGESVEAGTTFEVDLPKPRVLAVTVRATNAGTEVVYEEAMCYEGLAFNPGYKTERLELPPAFVSELEYRDRSSEKGQESIYEDCRHILLYTDGLLDEKQWPTVGGEVLPLLVLPDMTGFATGQYKRIKNGEEYVGGIGSNENGEMFYWDKDGNEVPYRFIYTYIDDKSAPAAAKL